MKGKMKKLVALALATIMVLAMGITAAAADITINNAVAKETYTLYKLFDVSVAEGATDESGYTYYLTADDYKEYGATLEAAGVEFTASADESRYTVDEDSINAATLASKLKDEVDNLNQIISVTATSNTVTFTDLEAGYYFVDSSLGSLCSLNTTSDTAIIVEKNSVPSITKDVLEDSNNSWGEEATADFGQAVSFRLTVNTGTNREADGTGVDDNYVITDVLPAGMTYKEETIRVTGLTSDKVTSTYDSTNKTLTITLDSDAVAALGQNADIVITYEATLDNNAVVGYQNGNSNTATLTYHNQISSDIATVRTFAIGADDMDGNATITKVDGSTNTPLSGVGFTLTNEGGQYATVSGTKFDGWSTDTAKIYTDAEGEIHVEGLDAGTYTLTETDPLAGYNALNYTITVEIEEDGTVTYISSAEEDGTPTESIEIVNSTGSILPSTGGIGTTIFYVVGGVLVVCAGVLLITKKRMSKHN